MSEESHGYAIGLTGSTTLIGKELLRMLPDSGLPFRKVRLLGGEESRGQLSEYDGEPQIVEVIDEDSLMFLDAVIFCETPELVESAVPLLDKFGILGIDVNGKSELTGLFETAVAGVNRTFPADEMLLRSPHPATVLIVHVLRELLPQFPFRKAHAVVILPASTKGEGGLEELCRQTAGLLNMTGIPTEVFGHQIAFNLIPLTDEASQRKEEIITKEIAEVLPESPPFQSMTFLEGPLFHGISILLVLESTRKLNSEKLERTFDNAREITFHAEDGPATSADIGESENIEVSPLPLDESRKLFRLWIVGDQIRCGFCLNAIGLLSGYLKANK